MTNEDAYLFGWVYGMLVEEIRKTEPNYDPPDDLSARPFSSNVQILDKAHQMHIVTPAIDDLLAEKLSQIKGTSAEMVDGLDQEVVQPWPVRGSWQIGFCAGRVFNWEGAGKVDVAKLRKSKGMTQTQLAEALGVTQSRVSRWESGTEELRSPYKEQLEALLCGKESEEVGSES